LESGFRLPHFYRSVESNKCEPPPPPPGTKREEEKGEAKSRGLAPCRSFDPGQNPRNFPTAKTSSRKRLGSATIIEARSPSSSRRSVGSVASSDLIPFTSSQEAGGFFESFLSRLLLRILRWRTRSSLEWTRIRDPSVCCCGFPGARGRSRDASRAGIRQRGSPMFRRFKLFIGVNARTSSSKRLLHAQQSTQPRRAILFQPPAMLDTIHEVAVYIHRFHNLDLFQQGWYQIRVSMRWEDNSRQSPGTPARVVQYEVPGTVSDSVAGVWRIDDADHSFSTQPFRIKYARQDVPLSVMVSFNLAVEKDEILSTPGVILRFDLMYAPILENGFEMSASLDTVPAAVHEFRIPPKALLGLHSYCPVHFDSFHAILIDLSIHIVLLKALSHSSSQKVPSISYTDEAVAREQYDGQDQVVMAYLSEWACEVHMVWGQAIHVGSGAIDLVKSLSIARDILLEELQNISKAIGQTIDDLIDSQFSIDVHKPIDADAKSSGLRMGGGQLAGGALSSLERSNGIIDIGDDVLLHSLSKGELLDTFHNVGNQLSFLWNTFLQFHRGNRAKILEHLRDAWANDRKAEWSIWMVHSKIDIPHRYMRSGSDESSHHSVLGKASVPRKSSDDPAHTATTRAELHRRSIAQMKINNRSIQDMYIFGDPSHVPVVLVEQHVMNAPKHSSSHGLYLGSLEQNDLSTTGTGDKALLKLLGGGAQKNSRILRAVVFVHGFQA
ncbi:hypothetical protein Taro_017713, partial [Colocasia esculenta]|nr:hypothetical protein [Colocasia esculenta]